MTAIEDFVDQAIEAVMYGNRETFCTAYFRIQHAQGFWREGDQASIWINGWDFDTPLDQFATSRGQTLLPLRIAERVDTPLDQFATSCFHKLRATYLIRSERREGMDFGTLHRMLVSGTTTGAQSRAQKPKWAELKRLADHLDRNRSEPFKLPNQESEFRHTAESLLFARLRDSRVTTCAYCGKDVLDLQGKRDRGERDFCRGTRCRTNYHSQKVKKQQKQRKLGAMGLPTDHTSRAKHKSN